MKYFRVAILIFAGGIAHLPAQTNANTNAVDEILALVTTNSPEEPKPARAPTRIQSDSADFDLGRHTAIYQGHVRVDDPQMKLWCEQLLADLPQGGGHMTNIVAITNVVIDFTDDKGKTNHATSEKAVYVYNLQNGVTNETVTLTGNPKLKTAQGWTYGEPIVWDRIGNRLRIVNPRMVIYQNINDAGTGTNSPPKGTNFPASTITNVTDRPPAAN